MVEQSNIKIKTIHLLLFQMILLAIALVILSISGQRDFVTLISGSWPIGSQLLIGLVTGATCGGGAILVLWAARRGKPQLEHLSLLYSKPHGTIIALSLITGICEEVFFRAMLQPLIGLWGAAAIFMLAHAQFMFQRPFDTGKWIFGISIFSMGLAFGKMYSLGGIFAAIGAHAAFDIVILLYLKRVFADKKNQADEKTMSLPSLKIINARGQQIAYRLLKTQNKPTIVILTALASTCAEWLHLADTWQKDFSVLLYDRPGYGQSPESETTRSPESQALELKDLLEALGLTKVILVGHSLGGLYAYTFAKLYPQLTLGLVLIDPVSPLNCTLRENLTKEEFAASGIEKGRMLRSGYLITRLRLGFFFKPLLRKAPPFYYFAAFSKEATSYILASATSRQLYRTALAEYAFIEGETNPEHHQLAALSDDLPLALVLHSEDFMVHEIMKYGGADEPMARKIDAVWCGLMRQYLTTSRKSLAIVAKNSGHFVHLSEPETVMRAAKLVTNAELV